MVRAIVSTSLEVSEKADQAQVKVIAHKQIAHLTYDRNRLDATKGQQFPWVDIEAALDGLVEAFNKSPRHPQLEPVSIRTASAITTTGCAGGESTK